MHIFVSHIASEVIDCTQDTFS